MELHGYYEMTNEEYHSSPGVSKSGLDLVARSPKHYWDRYVNPDYEPEEETEPKRQGTAIHTAILEPDRFESIYASMPENLNRTTKAGKEYYAELTSQNKLVLKHDDYQECLKVRDAVHSHPVAGQLLTYGRAEQTFFVKEPETGLLTKCRPDWITDSGVMVDVKSTEDASRDGFARSVANYRYYVQAPWYLDVLKRLYGDAPEFFVFLAIEKSRPHAIGVYYVEEADLQKGRDRYFKDLRKIAECQERNLWPDYCLEIDSLKLPPWLNP